MVNELCGTLSIRIPHRRTVAEIEKLMMHYGILMNSVCKKAWRSGARSSLGLIQPGGQALVPRWGSFSLEVRRSFLAGAHFYIERQTGQGRAGKQGTRDYFEKQKIIIIFCKIMCSLFLYSGCTDNYYKKTGFRSNKSQHCAYII